LTEVGEDGEALFGWRRWRHLQEDGLPFGKYQGGGAKNAEGLHGKGMVFGKPCQQPTVPEVLLEPGHVKVSVPGYPNKGAGIGDIAAVFVSRSEEGNMEPVKGRFALLAGSLGCAEGEQPATGVVFRLVPNFPFRALLTIDLLQTEIPPIDGQLRSDVLFHSLQPNCCVVDIGSEVVEVDVYGEDIARFRFSHFSLLLCSSVFRINITIRQKLVVCLTHHSTPAALYRQGAVHFKLCALTIG